MSNLLLKDVRPMGKEALDVLVQDGKIQQLAPSITAPDDIKIIDGMGHLLLPGLVNAHAHIDKNLLGLPWRPNSVPEPRRIKDYVDNECQQRIALGLDTAKQSAIEVQMAIEAGVTHIRTHVDIDTDAGLKHWEGVLQTQETFKDQLTMQTVAFPQSGMLIRQGTVELLEEAVKMGADAIGGLDPSTVDRDPVKHIDTVFEIADRHGVEVDIHLHEPGMLGAFSVELIAERTKALGLQGKVTISHVFCLGMVDDAYLDKLIRLILDNDITIMSLGSGSGAFPPLKKLHEAGVKLCTGTDGVHDLWGIYNSVNMLDRVRLLGYRCGFRRDEDVEFLLNVATYGGASVMKDDNYGLEIEDNADFIVITGETSTEAVVNQPTPKFVVKRGQVVASDGNM
jgi:cytosine/creatinine deaminase